jgi:multidrug efflux system outer membrane protein
MNRKWMKVMGGLLIWLTGCATMAPPHEVPEVELPSEFKSRGPWKEAAPADEVSKGEWWQMFGDPELNRLQGMVVAHNPTLEAALKRVEQARAGVDEGRATLVPQIGLGFNVTQNRTSSNSPGFRPGQTLEFWRAPITFQYELDLWGRVRGGVRAARATLSSQEALAENVRLILQAELAAQYWQLRALDSEKQILDEAVALRRKTLQLVETRFKAGDVAELDLAQAQRELTEAQSESIGIEQRRAERENAVAALCGQVPSMLKLKSRPLSGGLPKMQRAMPSSLLERRPDVAAAERAMAAANERVGMARTAFFPQVGIGLGGGLESAVAERLFEGDSFLSSIGTGVELPVMDGGLRRARWRRAQAEREELAALYKETVITAFREVEDALAAIRVLEKQAAVQAETVQAARRTVELAEKRYEAGFVSFFEVVDGQRALLRVEQTAAQIQGARFEAMVRLVRALGGGF